MAEKNRVCTRGKLQKVCTLIASSTYDETSSFAVNFFISFQVVLQVFLSFEKGFLWPGETDLLYNLTTQSVSVIFCDQREVESGGRKNGEL